jgi:hypothetical protein
MVESQTTKKELLEEEIDISFFIQLVKVQGSYNTYYKLYAKISSNEEEINYQHLSPEEYTVHNILESIEKLYDVYRNAQNEKLMQGAKEEILKLIALIIWNINH